MVRKFKVKKCSKNKKIFLCIGGSFLAFVLSFIFLLYGPYDGFRNFWITTSMTTMSHQYLAKWFYSDEVIQKVLAMNEVIESKENTNTNLVKIKKYGRNMKVYKNKYEEQILKKDKDNDLYKVIEINGTGYKGYLVAIYDPSKVSLATSRYIGTRGEAITTVAKNEDAVIAINAGGFYDPDWNSNGGVPHGVVISNGKLIGDYRKANVGGGIVGFDKDNKLVLGRYSAQEALKKGIRDCVEFGPYLIVNGKSSFVRGNGGWGIAPRTAIGQRKDGIVLFLIINGRIPSSIGADMSDLTEVMENYGAVNAANMDGGSSTELVIHNEIINKPVAAGKNGLRDLPTFWIVKE
ncbi:MAG: phosphodiester glycosidase family protein [Bacilli bacterium]|nr:phosphodiester glycosidase family protein [Bacilli bacterium]